MEGEEGGAVPLSEHEERILHDLEERLKAHDPKFADRVQNETVYRYAGRNCWWSALGFVVGLAILIGFFATNVGVGFLGFLIMLGSAVFFEQNLRRMGKAGLHDVRRSIRQKGGAAAAQDGWEKFRKRFRREEES